jgi:adenosylcobinamide kinase / adenosylcobinamide-phosphate guanylyltransferase
MHELIIGGCRSGKSRCAQRRAADWLARPGRSACLIATAIAGDDEMRERVARHRDDRARELPSMQTLEVPRDLPEAVRACSREQQLVVVDCLTLWLTNWLMPMAGASVGRDGADGGHAEMEAAMDRLLDEAQWQGRQAALIDALAAARGPVVLVSNEIGWGVSPLGAPARRFVDALGQLHQRIAQACGHVTLMVAGQELSVKGRR